MRWTFFIWNCYYLFLRYTSKYINTLQIRKTMLDLYMSTAFYLFVLTFAIKLKDDNYKSHRNILVFCNEWKKCKTWIWPVKHFLIWFKLCLSSILVISWEIQIINLTEIVYFSIKQSVVRSKFAKGVFLSYLYFWNYWRNFFWTKNVSNDFKIYWKTSLKILYLKGYKWLLSQNHWVDLTFLVIDSTSHWQAYQTFFKK